MRSTSFFHVSVPNIYGTTYLKIFLKVISKVLFFNITQKLTKLSVRPDHKRPPYGGDQKAHIWGLLAQSITIAETSCAYPHQY